MAKAATRPKKQSGGRGKLPSRDELLRYVSSQTDEVTKRDLARAFGLKGQERAELKRMLRELRTEGALAGGRRRRVRPAERLPGVTVLEVRGIDADGELIARPASGSGAGEGQGAHITLAGDRVRGRAPGVGDRVLARLTHLGDDTYRASVIRVLPRAPGRVVGVIEKAAGGYRVRPLGPDRGHELSLRPDDAHGAEAGEVVAVERIEGKALGLARAQVTERLGAPDDPRAISLIAAHIQGLPIAFPEAATAQAERAKPVGRGRRHDLRRLPLVTIDGADARDFDDAVFAAPDDDPKNPGGWHVVVAIADVAHYVRPGDALDREARRRGNSAYFPDRVLPMLPHALSNGLCSLRPDEERACLAVHMWLDKRGKKLRHRFVRGLMRSRARLTYEQVQAAADGTPDETTEPLVDAVIRPLYGAFSALLEARRRRATLDLDIPEVEVRIDPETGRPAAVEARPRLDSHRVIEELMITANVAAAETLEEAGMPCMYRVHDRPDPVKLEALSQLLESLGFRRTTSTLSRPRDLARLLAQVHEHELAAMVSSFVLRAQSQAVYSPDNLGHFGLNLKRYAHFTSPIRRYADLLVHRALIRGLGLGGGGLEDGVSSDDWREVGGWISRTERRAMEAERNAQNRFVALFMAERIGGTFAGSIASVQRFGLFVQLDGLQVDGLVPISTLDEYYRHEPAHHALIGEETGDVIALGDRVRVKLVEADALTGQLAFRLIEHTPGAAARAAARHARQAKKAGRRFRRRPARH